MPTSIITTEDLAKFKEELLFALKELLNSQSKVAKENYLRSSEVIEQLKISPSKLYSWRKQGIIPYSKVEGIIYYKQSDIQELLDSHSQHLKSS